MVYSLTRCTARWRQLKLTDRHSGGNRWGWRVSVDRAFVWLCQFSCMLNVALWVVGWVEWADRIMRDVSSVEWGASCICWRAFVNRIGFWFGLVQTEDRGGDGWVLVRWERTKEELSMERERGGIVIPYSLRNGDDLRLPLSIASYVHRTIQWLVGGWG